MGKLWLAVFITITLLILHFFVFQQWYLVSSTWGFVALIVVFVSLSFTTSAIETAFSTAHLDERIQEALEHEAAAIALRYDEFDKIVRAGTSLEQFSSKQKKAMKKLERAKALFHRKRASLEETSRSVYVGTFASLSVFLNIALAAMLPYALVSQPPVIHPIELDVIKWISFSGSGLTFVWQSIDLSGQKILVFFASSFPILVFGKVVPKEIGALFNFFFAYRINVVARWAVTLFGFIPKALRWPLEALRHKVQKARATSEKDTQAQNVT